MKSHTERAIKMLVGEDEQAYNAAIALAKSDTTGKEEIAINTAALWAIGMAQKQSAFMIRRIIFQCRVMAVVIVILSVVSILGFVQ